MSNDELVGALSFLPTGKASVSSDDIATARELLEQGWTVGTYYDREKDAYCSVGAVAAAKGLTLVDGNCVLNADGAAAHPTEHIGNVLYAVDVLFEECGLANRHSGGVIQFNDQPRAIHEGEESRRETREEQRQRVLDAFTTVEKFLRDKGE